ncbi:MAG TPA: anti-sigma factor [Rhodanobacteraceae bacterium]
MNTPLHNGHDELRYAEYVLGVLDAAARAAVAQEMRDDPQAAAAVAAWTERLAPLGEDVAASTPPDYVWARIQSALGHPAGIAVTPASDRSASRGGLWNSLALWRWLGIGSGVVAAACLAMVIFVVRPKAVVPTAATASYMVARIQQGNGVAGWTATMDLAHARMVVIPATPQPVASGHSTQLWLIPPGHKPISLGLIAENRPTTVRLSSAQLRQLGPKALLAVSVEPHGGSPTGQPTGPVVAKGLVGAASHPGATTG